jgi:membrane-associated protease RseP (regulator of RpoE activity)
MSQYSELAVSSSPEISLRRARELALAAPQPRYWLHGLLLMATCFTTLIVGAQLQLNFLRNQPAFSLDESLFPVMSMMRHPAQLILGIPFAATLMLILLAHELGHYITARRHDVQASLPYFIPAPTLIGTLGAFIRIRSRIPSRRALFDIGVAGPIAGFALAVPALIWGTMLSRWEPNLARASDLQLGYPQLFRLLAPLAQHGAIRATFSVVDIYLHPVAIAAWVGLFATALNLLPGGQLDGGHLVYALWPGAHKWISRGLVVALLAMSPFLWPGWLLWAGMLLSFGRRHPYVPEAEKLGPMRAALAALALFIFLLSFTPAPFPGTALQPAQVKQGAVKLLHFFR